MTPDPREIRRQVAHAAEQLRRRVDENGIQPERVQAVREHVVLSLSPDEALRLNERLIVEDR